MGNDTLVYDIKKLKFDPHGIRYTHQIAAEIAHDICEVDIPAWDIDGHLQGLYQTAYVTAFCVFAAEGEQPMPGPSQSLNPPNI